VETVGVAPPEVVVDVVVVALVEEGLVAVLDCDEFRLILTPLLLLPVLLLLGMVPGGTTTPGDPNEEDEGGGGGGG